MFCCKRITSVSNTNIRRCYSNCRSTGSLSQCPFLGNKTSTCSPIITLTPRMNKKSFSLQKEQKEVINRDHPLYPQRDGLDDNEFGAITWRGGEAFDYTFINAKYLHERIGQWSDPNSLEQTVSNLVKTLEMELTNKSDPKQWVSMAADVFRYRGNDGEWVETKGAVEKGSYNILLQNADPKLYDPSLSFEESHNAFFTAFPKGFMWEVLKVYSGPPKVAFTWRHWGEFDGVFNTNQGNDELIVMYGFATVKVQMPNENDPRIRVQEIEVWYDMNKFLCQLNGVENNSVHDAAFGMECIEDSYISPS